MRTAPLLDYSAIYLLTQKMLFRSVFALFSMVVHSRPIDLDLILVFDSYTGRGGSDYELTIW